jgi:hypothetical protein
MGESDGRSNDQLFSNQRLYWSGRGDLNARPPAPKADYGLFRKAPVFNYLNPKELFVGC